MSKKGGTQRVTQTNALDPETQKWVQEIYRSASGAANTPYNPSAGSRQAGDFLSGAVRGGNLGFGALMGDPNAVRSFMNPYTDEVIKRVEGDQARLQAGTMKGVNDYATKAGAFGGSRHGVATGTALAESEQDGADRIAGLRHTGYTDAMGRAQSAANLGFSAAPMLDAYGRYDQQMRDPNYRRMTLLREGMMGLPYGTSSETSQPMQRNWMQGVLGGAISGKALAGAKYGPWGALAGGLFGALGG
jgi:hypothetical protein